MNKCLVLFCVLMLFLQTGCDQQKARSELKEQGIDAREETLQEEARQGKNEAVQLLLRAGCSANAVEKYSGRTPLMNAAENGHLAVVKTLVDARANVNQAIVPKVFRSVLRLAVANVDIPRVQFLIEHGLDLTRETNKEHL